MITEVLPRGAVDYTPAGSVMFGGIDATIIADPGDGDRSPVFTNRLSLFAFIADNSRELGDRMVGVLIADIDAWREATVEAAPAAYRAELAKRRAAREAAQ